MNEDVFNTSLRGFLKKVGITSQREIEKAVRDAVASGKLKGNEKLPAKMTLTHRRRQLHATISQARSNWVRGERGVFLPLSPCGRGWLRCAASKTGEGSLSWYGPMGG